MKRIYLMILTLVLCLNSLIFTNSVVLRKASDNLGSQYQDQPPFKFSIACEQNVLPDFEFDEDDSEPEEALA